MISFESSNANQMCLEWDVQVHNRKAYIITEGKAEIL